MHQTNDEIRIGENAEVTQHDWDFKDTNVGDDGEHLEAPHILILAINIAKRNAHIL